MKLDENNLIVPGGALPRGIRLRPGWAHAVLTRVQIPMAGLFASTMLAGQSFAVTSGGGGGSSANGIGSQIQNMAQEGSTTAGFVGSTAMYGAALICLIGGAWALWQSRQPQQREGGKVAMGVAGLVLCGLFAAGGTWIDKAANTTSGGTANISSTAGVVTFGAGG